MASTAGSCPGESDVQQARLDEVRSACHHKDSPQVDLTDGAELVAAHASDHSLIHELLMAVVQGPTVEEFQASVDDPAYEPRDRLLIKRNGRIISHVHLTHRMLRFGQVALPLSEIQRLTWTWNSAKTRSAEHDHDLVVMMQRQLPQWVWLNQLSRQI